MVSLLPGYEAQMSEDGVAHSRDKLRSSLDSFLSVAPHPSTTTLLPSTSEESHSYRAACGFQIIRESELPSSPPSPSHDPLVYCMRNDFRPVSLQSKVFSIANPRIQVSMELTIDFLNSLPPSHPFLEHLTSCKFVTSWDEKECFLTLSYGDAVSNSAVWEERGAELAGLAGLTAVTARFKKTKLVVGSSDTVHDTIVVEGVPIVSVRPDLCSFALSLLTLTLPRSPRYEKPEDAFQHPNPCTMHKALVWMFEQMRAVAAAHPRRALNLLEMYVLVPASRPQLFLI